MTVIRKIPKKEKLILGLLQYDRYLPGLWVKQKFVNDPNIECILRGNPKKHFIKRHCPKKREGGQPHFKKLKRNIFLIKVGKGGDHIFLSVPMTLRK